MKEVLNPFSIAQAQLYELERLCRGYARNIVTDLAEYGV